MHRRDYRDIIGGTTLVLGGVFVVAYATSQLQIGSLGRMGPGLFPAALGVLLCFFGILLAVPALFRPGTLPTIELRSLVFVLASILVFGLTIRRFGVAPAVIALTLVAALADRQFPWLKAVALAVALAVIAVLIFNVGLEIPVEAIRWWGK
jgi:hypothetical protein